MLDIRWMRENRAALAEAMQKLNDPDAPWAIALELDERRRQILTRVETLRAERNAGSKRVGELFREKKTQEANELKEQMSAIGGEIEALDVELRDSGRRLPGRHAAHPQHPRAGCARGQGRQRKCGGEGVGGSRTFDFVPCPTGTWRSVGHHRLRAGVKLSGSRFYLLKGAGARLQRALIDWFLDVHVQEHGYTEIYPPFMVRAECMTGTGNLPKFGDNLYRDAEEDYWLIPTAEVPVTNSTAMRSWPQAAADLLRGLHPLLPPREGVGGQGCARHQARPPVPEGGDGQVCGAAARAG
jgi:seryl-tRNA synthetase